MRMLSLFAVLLLASGTVLAGKAEPMTARLLVSADVDAHGRVTALQFDNPDLPAPIREPLARDMRGWEFEPARVDGRPVPSRTHVYVSLLAEPLDASGEAYALRITEASNGPAFRAAPPPRYPQAALRSRTTGEVILQVRIAADGTVADVEVESIRSNRSRGRGRSALEAAAVESVRGWTFEPEQVDGRPIAQAIKVPIRYCMGTRTCMGEAPQTPQAPATREQQLIAEHPATRLKSEVVGRTL